MDIVPAPFFRVNMTAREVLVAMSRHDQSSNEALAAIKRIKKLREKKGDPSLMGQEMENLENYLYIAGLQHQVWKKVVDQLDPNDEDKKVGVPVQLYFETA